MVAFVARSSANEWDKYAIPANTESLRKSGTQYSLSLFKVVGFLAFLLSSEILQ